MNDWRFLAGCGIAVGCVTGIAFLRAFDYVNDRLRRS